MLAMASRGVVDLRSDTLTKPTEPMRQAMATAPVGDDRYGEDPTVNRLEERFAELVGKPAAMYVPSGTMGNQIALRLHGAAGSNVVVGRKQHLMSYESGAAGLNNAFQLYAVDDAGGVIDTDAAAEAVAAGNGGFWPPVSLICLENTHLVFWRPGCRGSRDGQGRRVGAARASRRCPVVQCRGGTGNHR